MAVDVNWLALQAFSLRPRSLPAPIHLPDLKTRMAPKALLALGNKRFKLSSWKILEPFFNVQHVFAYDLALARKLTTRRLPPGIAILIFRRPPRSYLEQIIALLSQASVPRQITEDRLKRGDVVALAMADHELAAYTWATFDHAWIAEARRFLPLGDNEAAQFDTLVMPAWRGQGLQYAVTAPLLRYLAKLGIKRTLAWVNARNTRSIRNQVTQGKRRIATIYSSPVLGLVRVRRLCQDTTFILESRIGKWREVGQ